MTDNPFPAIEPKMSPEYKEFSAALFDAINEITFASKSSVNPHFKNKYAALPEIIAAIKPALAAHHLFMMQDIKCSESSVTVTTVIRHRNGWVERMGAFTVPATKSDAQGMRSARTYACRTSMETVFVVPSEDDDAEGARRADEAQAKARQKRFDTLHAVADAIVEKFDRNDLTAAFEEFEGLTEVDDRAQVWGLLKSRSEIRSAIKKYGEQLRAESKVDAETGEIA